MKTKKKPTKARRQSALDSGALLLAPFRVWIEQVNQTYVDVTAGDAEQAQDKAYRIWRREYAHARVGAVKRMDGELHAPARKPVELENAELGDEG